MCGLEQLPITRCKLKSKQLIHILALLLAILILHPSPGAAQDFPDVCQDPANILANCNFNSGLDHWQPFLETGAADITVLQGGGECHAPLCPAAYIVSNDHFIGGIYQQVPVTRGANYYANIVWLVFDSLANDAAVHQATGGIGRRIGIDPFGGTDPRSPNIVWSPDNWRNDCKICNVEQVTVTAQADTMTVFLRIENTWKLRAAEKGFSIPPSKDQFWIDDIGLKPVDGAPIAVQVQQPATDTPTPAPPPTNTPEAPPPTNTPVPPANTPTAAATPVAQADTPAAEPDVTAAPPTFTYTPPPPPPTLTPTNTPSPTSTRQPRPSVEPTRPRRATPTPQASQLPLVLGAAGTTACLGGVALVLVAAVMAGLVWLYRLGWGSAAVEEEYYDDNEGINVEDVES